jgi:preprotein translocase subunit SecE
VSAVSDNAGKLDTLKWLVALAVLVAGLYANAEYAALTLLYRVLAGIVVAGVFVAIALTTVQGRATWDLAKEARVEIRKVVWPTRQETAQTTLIVVVMVIFVGLILWALDSTLSWSVSGLIG